jgi:chromosome segregation ATPase
MKALGALALPLLLGACQLVERVSPAFEAPSESPTESPTESPAEARGDTPRSHADELVAYLARIRTLNESGLNAEAARQKQLAARQPSDLTRLKAALALALSGPADDNEISVLVDPLARNPRADGDLRAMASFLQAIANERRRLKENAVAARTTLRDERRALEAQKQRADALQERAAQLQQKLDALTELEKSLSDRPPPSR